MRRAVVVHSAVSDGRIKEDARPMAERDLEGWIGWMLQGARIGFRDGGREGMKVRLNLATKPLETHRRFLWCWLTAVVAGLLFLALGWHVHSRAKSTLSCARRTGKSAGDGKLEAQRRLERYFSQKDIANCTIAPPSSIPSSTRAASIGR